MAQRDKGGRFAKGHKGGPGRPTARKERTYLTTMTQVVTAEEWARVTEKALEQALEGDHRARTWLSDYIIGKPQPVQAEGEAVVLQDVRLQVVRVSEKPEET